MVVAKTFQYDIISAFAYQLDLPRVWASKVLHDDTHSFSLGVEL